ncbi:MAG: hypothetical protein V7L20_15795 [Nostoc sp.]|uniref:hypothetical protein n=1 Tax=Nostoc sp. TaxID=1180 RepID=UPI002FF84229
MKIFNLDFGLVHTPIILSFIIFSVCIPVHAQNQYESPNEANEGNYKHGLSVRTQCFQDLRRDISTERVARLCRNATGYTSQCFQELRDSISLERAEKLCRIATPYTSQCFLDLRNVTSTERATRLCNFALADTSQCFRVLNQQISTNRAEKECLPPLASALQACVDSLTFDAQGYATGISETVAVISCRKTFPFKYPLDNSD